MPAITPWSRSTPLICARPDPARIAANRSSVNDGSSGSGPSVAIPGTSAGSCTIQIARRFFGPHSVIVMPAPSSSAEPSRRGRLPCAPGERRQRVAPADPAHLREVHHEVQVADREVEELPVMLHVAHRGAGEVGRRRVEGLQRGDRGHEQRADGATDHPLPQIGGEGVDLGQLGHASILRSSADSCTPAAGRGLRPDLHPRRSRLVPVKIARFTSGGSDPQFGIVDDEDLVVLAGDPMFQGFETTGERVPIAEAKLLAPVIPRSKIVCVGMNYPEHKAELAPGSSDRPVIFLKPNTAIIGPGDAIQIPPVEGRIVHEGELAIVIGAVAKRVRAEDADDVIFGYTIANDVSARDQMFADGQWARAKGYDTFCPIGPVIETEIDRHGARHPDLRRRGAAPSRQHARHDPRHPRDRRVRLRHLDAAARRPDPHRNARGARRIRRRPDRRDPDPGHRPAGQPRAQPGVTRQLPGLAVALAAVGVGALVHLVLPAVPLLTVCVLLGVIAAQVPAVVPALDGPLKPGLATAAKRCMRIGVVLLGLQLVVGDLLRLGWLTILAVIGVTAFAFAGTYVIGRIARLPGHEPLLFAAGFAICGASAIGAMAAVTRQRRPRAVAGPSPS